MEGLHHVWGYRSEGFPGAWHQVRPEGIRQASQSAYVRACCSCFGEERRYITGPGGDVWYKLRSRMGEEKILAFQGTQEVIGSCMFRQDSTGGISLSLSLR